MMRLSHILFLSAAVVLTFGCGDDFSRTQSSLSSEVSSGQRLQQAFRDHESGFMIEVGAPVVRILSDDNDGSRHQRFLIRLSTGQTILVSHNVDLAPRVRDLRVGDTIDLYGQYEWNEKGGMIHWTHHDPRGAHEEGFIEHNGRRYQ